MKKFKLNAKLTACLVSLFIGIILMILGNKSRYCLSFGMVFLGLGSILYSWHKGEESKEIDKEIDSTLAELDYNNPEHSQIGKDLYKMKKQNKKKTTTVSVTFTLFALMMIVLAVFASI